jgi:hypothetical protein
MPIQIVPTTTTTRQFARRPVPHFSPPLRRSGLWAEIHGAIVTKLEVRTYSLLVPQRGHRINLDSPPCRSGAGNNRDQA